LRSDVVAGRKPRHVFELYAKPVGEDFLGRFSGESATHDFKRIRPQGVQDIIFGSKNRVFRAESGLFPSFAGLRLHEFTGFYGVLLA